MLDHMWRLPTHRQLVRALGVPMSDRHWQVLRELVVTAAAMDVDHAAATLEVAQGMLALSLERQGAQAIGPEPNGEALRRTAW